MGESRTEKNSYTVIFAIVMVFVVGALLAFAAKSLEPTITENERLEKQQNILYAMGINQNVEGDSNAEFVSTKQAPSLFKKYIKEQVVITNGPDGMKVEDDDQAYLIDVKKQKEIAKSGGVRKLPLFIGEKDGRTFYIAPIRGKGLWDAIWAYVAMDKDMVVEGAYFDHAGETPGLGANMNKRFFMDDFTGENLKNNEGVFVGINVTKGNGDPNNEDKTDNKVDALSGATITSNGITAMIKNDLKLYIPYFKKLENQ